MEVHIEMNVSDAHKTVNLKIFCSHQSMKKKKMNSDSDELELATEADIRTVRVN